MIVAFIVLEPVFLQTVTYSQADLSQGEGLQGDTSGQQRALGTLSCRDYATAWAPRACGAHGRVKILDTKFPGELRLPPVPKYGRSLSSRLLILYNSIVVGQSSPRNLKEIDVFYVVFP